MEDEIPMVTSPTNVSGKKSKPGVNFKTNQERLLEYLEEKNISEFKKLLERKDENKINPDHVYDRPCNKTCLAEASMKGMTEFIDALLNNGADPNFVCKFHSGRAAIHFAADKGHIDAIRCLVEHRRTQINVIDEKGDTALHLLASKLTEDGKNTKAFVNLASRKGTDVRHRNVKGQSAIEIAVEKCNIDTLIWKDVFLLHDLRPEDGQLMLEKQPEFKKYNRENFENIYTHDDAYTDLRNKNFEGFKVGFKEEFVNQTDLIETTFLQLACRKGYLDIVELLLRSGADVNKTGKHEKRPPVYLACCHGQYDILVRLFKKDNVHVGFVDGMSLLQVVLDGVVKNGKSTDGYRKCFHYLLQEKPQIPINHCNEYGHTAMHYAVELEDDYYTEDLLKHGAYIGYQNKFGFSPLHDIGPQLLEEILDSCVECKKTKAGSENQYNLKFNFNMLNPTETCDTTEQTKDAESGKRIQESLTEMGPLYTISRSNKLGHLLKHPDLLMFLHLKWTRICKFFYIYMIYYITFVIFLTVYILSETCSLGKCDGKSKPSEVHVILFVLTVILVVKELIHFCLLPKWCYFCKLDNLLRLFIIATTILILVGTSPPLLMAVTLLLAWMEVILQLGCIYSVAVYHEMMKRVTFNYVKFLFCYSPLILAFSFSFYILYHKESSSERKNGTFYVNSASGNFSVPDDNVDFYSNLHFPLLKTAIMMIGELDASNMSITDERYFVFLFFVFMMTIVLMNLLNGLAVSDIQAIKNDAELVACRSKVQMAYHFEGVVFGGLLKDRCRCQLTGGSPSLCCQWRRKLQKAISLFPDTFSDGKLDVVLNQGIRYTNVEMYESDSNMEHRPDTCCRIGKRRWGLHVDREVLIAAKDIVDRRTEQSQQSQQSQHEKDQIVSRMAKVEEDLEGCVKQLTNLEGLLKQLINNR